MQGPRKGFGIYAVKGQKAMENFEQDIHGSDVCVCVCVCILKDPAGSFIDTRVWESGWK